ncbi:Efflux pump periplasmic linker BepF [Caulifigura coniformis]|uniref:Efflux pump periplasmic linker BepF n=1 Tax=Caulifigura coniformis TaxID=2527983 RepID=A0A517SLK2_9PLAN|nr:efflux RND transporter periplasmic adaptor subunit [Caulifigura coniformis]QDT57002.1 Efflux pump periplasmic linker BepF [Caulifigura coniformis]
MSAIPRISVQRIVASGLLGLIAGCSKPPEVPPPQPIAVTATRPVRTSIVEWDEYVGRIDAIEEVEVRARVSGHLESTHFVEGQIVQEGDLLAILDQRPFRIAVELAEADLEGAEARAHEARAQLVQAEAEVRSAESQQELATKNLERGRRLVVSNAVTQEQMDVRESGFKQAVADLDVKAARVALAKSAVVTAEADNRAAQARLAASRLNLEYTEVRAPVSGRVGARAVTDGNLISGGSEQATLLTTIVSLDPIHVDFDADEQSYLRYMRLSDSGAIASIRESRLPAYVRLADEHKGFPHSGQLDFLDNRMNRRTATMRGRVILTNPDFQLTPGLFGKVRIPGSARYDAILIPDSAIATDQSEKYVYVLDDNDTVQRRKIAIGKRAQGLRIVREGLTGEEQIVLRGLQRVQPGAVVKATVEDTVALDDGLPMDARPVPRDQWLQSYRSKPAPETGDGDNGPVATVPTGALVTGQLPADVATENEVTP